VHGFFGNAVVLARALSYMLYNGFDGLKAVSQYAVLNANWLRKMVSQRYDIPYSQTCMHEFVASAQRLRKEGGVKALDIAKALLDNGFHAPTVYFPLVVDEALMMEPTETESLQTLIVLAERLNALAELATTKEGQSQLHEAPVNTPTRRVDEALAARKPRLTFDQPANH